LIPRPRDGNINLPANIIKSSLFFSCFLSPTKRPFGEMFCNIFFLMPFVIPSFCITYWILANNFYFGKIITLKTNLMKRKSTFKFWKEIHHNCRYPSKKAGYLHHAWEKGNYSWICTIGVGIQ